MTRRATGVRRASLRSAARTRGTSGCRARGAIAAEPTARPTPHRSRHAQSRMARLTVTRTVGRRGGSWRGGSGAVVDGDAGLVEHLDEPERPVLQQLHAGTL